MSQLVFRLRYPLHFVVYLLGFFAPWEKLLHLNPGGLTAHTWGLLAIDLHNLGVGSYLADTQALLIAGILFALAGALLRTWGAAYIGSNVVKSAEMHTAVAESTGDGILKAGPFAHQRNPLYAGTFLHTLALALLMPPTGALFCILGIGALQAWLISGEETFLREKLGPPYLAYCALVPRILPSLRARIPSSGVIPHWSQAFLGEIYFWGVAFSLAAAGWFYNPWLLTRCVIVSFGLSLAARAFIPQAEKAIAE